MLASADASLTPIAGGTDLLVSWHHVDRNGQCFLDLSRLDELRPFRLTDETLELGALTTYWDVIRSADVTRAFPCWRGLPDWSVPSRFRRAARGPATSLTAPPPRTACPQ